MSKKKTQLSLLGIDGEIAFSRTDVWAYYLLPTVPYEFKDSDSRLSLAASIDTAISSILIDSQKSVDCHLIITSRPLDVQAWKQSWIHRTDDWSPTDGFPDYVDEMSEYLDRRGFLNKEVYLGIHLGRRGGGQQSSNNGFLAAFKDLAQAAEKVLGATDYQIPEKEIEYWRGKARDYTRAIAQGHLSGTPATAEQVARLVKQTVYPYMPVPEVSVSPHERWGAGETFALAESFIENDRKFLKITQTDNFGYDMSGYRATLCFSRFPDALEFPEQEPWIHFASSLGIGVNFYSRFSVEPASKVRKDVGKKLQEAKDQALNATGAGGALPLEIQEQLQVATELEYTLNRQREPWVYGRHRIVIDAESEESLRDKVKATIDHYRNLNIEVTWPSGDQFDLLLESQPGDKVRLKAYEQRQSLSIISGGMPTAASSVGDRVNSDGRGWIGPFLGSTTSRIEEAVFLSPHVPIAQNNPPGILITGSPGGGKSFTAFTITCQMAMQGIWCIYIDPKGDAKPIVNLPGLGKVQLFDLARGSDGLLDPFTIGQDDKILMAIETIKLLMGGLSNEQQIALTNAVRTVSKEPEPSLNKVVDNLYHNETDLAAQGLGSTLDLIRDLPFARLCFAPQNQVNLRPDEGLTIITLDGLDLPPSDILPAEYSYPNRLAVAVMYLIATFTLQLMSSLDRSHPKAVIIDEAWAITSTTQGRAIIPKIARMGRAMNTALIMVSQNASDFTSQGLVNSMSTKLAFRAKSSEEIAGVLELFNLERNDANRDTIKGLNTGECLLQDVDGRIARVQVEDWNPIWKKAFDTNPDTRGKEAA